MASTSTSSPPSPDNPSGISGLVQQALVEFQEGLHSRMPPSRLRLFEDESSIREAGRLVRIDVTSKFMKTISKLNADESGNFLREFCLKIEEVIDEFLARNLEFKEEREAFLDQKITEICESTKTTMEEKLVFNPDMNSEDMEELLEDVKSRGLVYFGGNNHGNLELFNGKMEVLKGKLEELKKGMLKKHKPVQVGVEMEEDEAVTVEGYPSIKAEVIQIDDDDDLFENADVDVDVDAFHSFQVQIPHDQPESYMNLGQEVSEDNVGEVIDRACHSVPVPLNQDQSGTNLDLEVEGNRVGAGGQSEDDPVPEMDLMVSNVVSLKGNSDDANPNPNAGKRRLPLPQKSAGKRLKMNGPLTSKASPPAPEGDIVNPVVPQAGTSTSVPINPTSSTASAHPLIIRLSTDTVTMGTQVGDKFELLPSVAPFVAVDENGRVICGFKAREIPDHCSLQDLFGNLKYRRKITFEMDETEVSHELSLPFFLGLILKSMKNSAEEPLKKNFLSAILTVPVWLASNFRMEIKEAGIIAGFQETTLVNQDAVAAYAYVSKCIQGQGQDKKHNSNNKCAILVFSEMFGILSGTLWEHTSGKKTKPKPKSLSMIAYGWDDSVQEMKPSNKILDDLYSSIITGNGVGHVPVLKKTLFITDCPNWMSTFKASGLKYASSNSGPVAPEDLFGAAIFCEKTPEEMHSAVEEYLAIPTEYKYNQSYVKTSVNVTDAKLGNAFVCDLGMDMIFQKNGKAKLYQENVLGEEMLSIGTFQLRERDQKDLKNCHLLVTLTISKEAVVSVEGINVKILSKKKKNSQDATLPKKEDCFWVPWTPAEGDGGAWREDVIKVVDSILDAA